MRYRASAESLRSVCNPYEFPFSNEAERLSALTTRSCALDEKTVPGLPLNEQKFVDWDTLHFYQATTVAHGHILQVRQVWKADGYSLVICCTASTALVSRNNITSIWTVEKSLRTEELTGVNFCFR